MCCTYLPCDASLNECQTQHDYLRCC
jgi:hypothetical protein